MVILGLSITSSWENGHASTYRGLMRELCARGHHVLFLERDLPSYANHRDLPGPPYGRTELYSSFEDLTSRFGNMVRDADLVIVGSYVPDGIELGQWVTRTARGRTAFYDIDTPITLRTLAGGTCEYLCPELIPRYSLYLSFSGGPALRTLQHSYGAVAVRPLYAFADPELYRPSGIEPQWDLGYLGTYSSDRQPALERLLIDPARREPDLSFAVAGPQYPVELQWPRNVRLIEHLPLSEHCRFYNAQRFTLNVTRTDMAKMGFSPSIRLFEAAACGTPIISDYWKGLSTFFEPGIEILTARSKYDVLEILLHLPEKTRIELAAKARARVLLSHTAAHRAEQLEQYAHQLLVKSAKHRAGRASVPGAVISAAAKGVPPATTAQGTDSRSATISPQ
ncbi:MAG TPA: glycosyltransferase [Planctomycetota bacterium]